jgi:hypothetical protein
MDKGGATYTPIGTLSGTIPNQSNGFGTVFVVSVDYKMDSRWSISGTTLGKAINFAIRRCFAATNGPANGIQY